MRSAQADQDKQGSGSWQYPLGCEFALPLVSRDSCFVTRDSRSLVSGLAKYLPLHTKELDPGKMQGSKKDPSVRSG